MNYSVNYGVNNTHITEARLFPLYRDAIKFYNNLDKEMYPSKLIYKLVFNKAGYVVERIPKQYEFIGGISEFLLHEYILNQTNDVEG